MKKTILPIALLLALSMGGALNNEYSKTKADENYILGTILEAESGTTSCSIITNNPNASNRRVVDAGNAGGVTFNVDMEKEGEYAVIMGYYTGSGNPKLALTVNGQKTSYTVGVSNGWCQDTTRLPMAIRGVVTLKAGNNTIIYSSDNEGQNLYTNLDYIIIDKKDAPFTQDEVFDHFVADGMRIQAERCGGYVGNFVDKNIRVVTVDDYENSKVDGFNLSVDDDYLSCPSYKIAVPEDGDYILQGAYYANTTGKAKYNFTFRQADETVYNITLDPCVAGWNTTAYSSKFNQIVHLNKGSTIMYYNFTRNGFADFDWFRLIPVKEFEMGDKIEAEDYVYGDVNVMRHSSEFEFLSNYAIELAQGNVTFDITAPSDGKYKMYVAGFTADEEATLSVSVNGDEDEYLVGQFASGWESEVSCGNFLVIDLELVEGKNTIVVKKGGYFVDIDYFRFYKNKIKISTVELDVNTTEYDLSQVAEYAFDIRFSSSDQRVFKVSDNKIQVVSGGKALLIISYQIDDITVNEYINVVINKVVYTGDDLIAEDTNVVYDGEIKSVNASAPEGWSIKQTGNNSEVGSYDVTVTFSHPYYEDVVKTVKLNIFGSEYTGDDLIFEDQTVKYDGNAHSLIASAPIGWEIEYLTENTYTEVGVYEVTVRFTNDSYAPVTLTATLTIEKGSAGGCGGSVTTTGLMAGGVFLVALALLINEKRKTIKTK